VGYESHFEKMGYWIPLLSRLLRQNSRTVRNMKIERADCVGVQWC
jgi:hypothetical protein